LGGFERVGVNPQICELVAAAVLSLVGLKQAVVVMIRQDLGSFEQAMAKLNMSEFEWVTAGPGELGTGATAAGLKSDGGTWGSVKQEMWWRICAEGL
jgi:hypothetical protein